MSTDVSEMRAAFIIRAMIALMMEAAITSETSVEIQLRTRQYNPEDSELHTRCRENLKCHIGLHCFISYENGELLRLETVYAGGHGRKRCGVFVAILIVGSELSMLLV
jgi:hypothetical protein